MLGNGIVLGTLTTSVTANATSVRTKDGLSQLASDWHDLFERAKCNHVFLSHEWMTEWWDQWGTGHELFVIQVRDENERLIAIAPFYIRKPKPRWIGPRVLAFLASTYVASDHLEPLIEPGCETLAVQEIVSLLLRYRKEWDYIELADCDADSATLAELRHQFRAANLTEHITNRPDRPYTLLPPDFNEFLSTLGASVRYNFRRRLRNLQREGQLEVICLSENAAIQRRFADLMHLHRLRFDQIDRASSFRNGQLLEFHTGLLKRMAIRPWPRLYLLELDGQTIASLYGFSVANRFSFYQSGMDPDWTKLSPGMVMLGCSMEKAVETGHTEFDFLRGTQSYKLHWAKYSRKAVTIRFFDRRAKGLSVLLFLRTRRQAARLKKYLWRNSSRLWQQIVAKSQTLERPLAAKGGESGTTGMERCA